MNETQAKPRRSWFQFRLATLIVVVTAVSIGFGLLPWQLSLFLIGSIPALLTTALLLMRRRKPGAGYIAILIGAWLVFYLISFGPMITVTEYLQLDPWGPVTSACKILYYPHIWAVEQQRFEVIEAYGDYWLLLSNRLNDYSELVPLGVVLTAFGGWWLIAELYRRLVSPASHVR